LSIFLVLGPQAFEGETSIVHPTSKMIRNHGFLFSHPLSFDLNTSIFISHPVPS